MNSNEEEPPDNYNSISKRKKSCDNKPQTKATESYNHPVIGDKNKKRKIGNDHKRGKKKLQRICWQSNKGRQSKENKIHTNNWPKKKN